MVTADDIRRATEPVSRIAHRTAMLTSRSFDERARVKTWFKCENFQRGGAFKIRGAAHFLSRIPAEDLPRGVVAYSSGNHAQAVALAARFAGIPATLVMPTDAPRSKMEATRAQGARIVTFDRLRESREEIGARIAAETGATLVPPFDHAWTIAGQGTAALELLEQVPHIDAILAPVGGGGLLAGCSVIAKAMKPSIRVFGAEPAEANDTFLSLQAGRRIEIPPPPTIADGLRATQPGAITFRILQQNVEGVLLVSEQEIRETLKFLLMRMKILVEPSGAVSAAAVLFGRLPPDIEAVGVILSGGNMDYELLASL